MADDLELWTDRSPEVQPRSVHPATFGLARAAELVADECLIPPPALDPPEPPRPSRERGPFVTYLCLPWNYGDRNTGEAWHRLLCRLGRHEMAGGHTMQLGGDVVFVERRCRWCDVAP
ncbi:MAG TPA: hypothetical protein VHT97_00675 [Acidimicrobiales bacterium]|nr:hypothetical protein [Acidimicrobiales bacterium]